MGNPFPDQETEKKGIEELRALSEEAKGVLNHHLRNSLNIIKGNAELILLGFKGFLPVKANDIKVDERLKDIIKASDHIIEDLEKFGLVNK